MHWYIPSKSRLPNYTTMIQTQLRDTIDTLQVALSTQNPKLPSPSEMRASIASWSAVSAPESPNWVSIWSLARSPESCPSCSGVRFVFCCGNGSRGFTVAVAAAAAAEDDAAAMDAAMSMPAAVSAAAAATEAEENSACCSSWASSLPAGMMTPPKLVNPAGTVLSVAAGASAVAVAAAAIKLASAAPASAPFARPDMGRAVAEAARAATTMMNTLTILEVC
ncbi:hypothetical protein C8R44DRAFT_786173 [Mycena epipterygia]|nr:hypothetical protein C8R44DRAFT_786173 [Mycena epipterygia]